MPFFKVQACILQPITQVIPSPKLVLVSDTTSSFSKLALLSLTQWCHSAHFMSACCPTPPVMLSPETVSHCVCGEAAPRQHVRVDSRPSHQFSEHHVFNFTNTLHLELLVGDKNIIILWTIIGAKSVNLKHVMHYRFHGVSCSPFLHNNAATHV